MKYRIVLLWGREEDVGHFQFNASIEFPQVQFNGIYKMRWDFDVGR
jgi:hypothetical protein